MMIRMLQELVLGPAASIGPVGYHPFRYRIVSHSGIRVYSEEVKEQPPPCTITAPFHCTSETVKAPIRYCHDGKGWVNSVRGPISIAD